jgi:hypothetical protein
MSEQHVEERVGALYVEEMDRLAVLARSMADLKLDWLRATLERAEAIGPVVYPTLYRDADLSGQRRLVAAALEVRAVVADLTQGKAPA